MIYDPEYTGTFAPIFAIHGVDMPYRRIVDQIKTVPVRILNFAQASHVALQATVAAWAATLPTED